MPCAEGQCASLGGWLVGFFHWLCCLTLVFRWCWPYTVSVVPLGDVSTAVMSILKVWWNLKCQIIWIWCFSFGHLAVVLEQSLFKFWELILSSQNLKFVVLFVSFTVSALSAAASFLQLQVFAYFASKFFFELSLLFRCLLKKNLLEFSFSCIN